MAVKILNIELTDQIKELFETQLSHPVNVIYFFNYNTCDTCDETSQLLDEIAALSGKISIRKYNLDADTDVARKFNVSLAPSLVIAGVRHGEPIDYGIRFSGIPSGYEFGSLIQAILLVSGGDSGLQPTTRSQLKELNNPVYIRIFVTPT